MRKFPSVLTIISIGIILISHDCSGVEPVDQGSCFFSHQLKNPAFRDSYEKRLAAMQNSIPAGFNGAESMVQNIKKADYDYRGTGALDPASFICLTCHDGSNAQGIYVYVKNEGQESRDNARHLGCASHPVGMNYAGYSPRRRYIPQGSLDQSIVLIRGKVGCLSCHNPLNPAKKHLAMSNERSSLCFSCHIK